MDRGWSAAVSVGAGDGATSRRREETCRAGTVEESQRTLVLHRPAELDHNIVFELWVVISLIRAVEGEP